MTDDNKARLSILPTAPARTVQISKAPAPISPVRGTGYGPTIKQPTAPTPAPAQPIDWKHWRLVPMEPWQSSALSLNVNPENMQHHPQAWMGSGVSFTADSFPSRDVETEFNKRTAAIQGNLYDKAHFGKYYGAVSLQELAAWCIYAGYDNVPPELVAMAAPAPVLVSGNTPAKAIPPEFYSITIEGLPNVDTAGYERYMVDKATRNALGRYTMREAAEVMALAHGLESAAFIKGRMLPAFKAGLLAVLDPVDGGPVRSRACRDFYDIVTPDGINAWLDADGFAPHVRWPVTMTQTHGTESAAIEASEITQLDPLPTKTIGELFDGIEFTKERWIKNIGTTAWLKDANRGKGAPGVASSTWCPLTVARLVCARLKDATDAETKAKKRTVDALNNRFRTNPVLRPWKDAWDDYYCTFSDGGEA